MSITVIRLRTRSDFLRISKSGLKLITPSFILQVSISSLVGCPCKVRVGFTASKRVGKSVHRNRCKRRLRSAVTSIFPFYSRRGFDYVLIARKKCLVRDFSSIRKDLLKGMQVILRRLHDIHG